MYQPTPPCKMCGYQSIVGKKMFNCNFVPECASDYFLRKQGFQRPPVSVGVLPPAELKQNCKRHSGLLQQRR